MKTYKSTDGIVYRFVGYAVRILYMEDPGIYRDVFDCRLLPILLQMISEAVAWTGPLKAADDGEETFEKFRGSAVRDRTLQFIRGHTCTRGVFERGQQTCV